MIYALALAAEKAGTRPPVPRIETPSLLGYTFKITLALCAVLGVVLLFFYLLRKIRYGRMPFQRERKVEVVEFVSLGKWGLALVKAGKRYFLVGFSDGGVELLSEIEESELEEEGFAELLREEGEKI